MTTIRTTIAGRSWPQGRILILDFDFFQAIGGGQTFYRRMIERHPEIEFHYPSRGPDCRSAAMGGLPRNARPFAFDALSDLPLPTSVRHSSTYDQHYTKVLSPIAAAIQGSLFDVVEVPSFFPVAHLVRPVLGAYGSVARRISLGLLGWLSVSIDLAYEDEASRSTTRQQLEQCEANSVAAADALYTISELHYAENAFFGRQPTIIDIHNALEEFPLPNPMPPGSGPPDLWYVGRLDRAKGPDLFIEMAARIPRKLYRSINLTGPDNRAWSSGPTWSDKLLERAAELKLEVTYHGQLADAELRERVYRGRNVLVVPSRTDAFNYVSLEALVNGCPLLLSRHTGSAGFLQRSHGRIMPQVIAPEDVSASATALGRLLKNYSAHVKALRRELIRRPFRRPEPGFMDEVFSLDRIREPALPLMAAPLPLLSSTAQLWRPTPAAGTECADASVIVTVRDATDRLAATLGSLARMTPLAREVIVVDDGSRDPAAVRRLVGEYGPAFRLLRQGRQGEPYASNAGWMAASHSYVALLRAGEMLDPQFLTIGLRELDGDPAASVFLPLNGDTPRNALSVSAWSHAPGLLLRRTVLAAAGGLDVSLGTLARADLLLRLRAQGPTHGSNFSRPLASRAWGLTPPATEEQVAVLRRRAFAALQPFANAAEIAPRQQKAAHKAAGNREVRNTKRQRSMA